MSHPIRHVFVMLVLIISTIACGKNEYFDGTDSEKFSYAEKNILSQKRTTRIFSSRTLDPIRIIDFDKLETIPFRPNYLVFDEVGALYIVDFLGFKIHKFIPDNAWKHFNHHFFGKGVGQGPGEFSRVLDVKIFNNELYLTDEGTGSIEIYSTDGDYRRRITLSNHLVARQITVQEGGIIVISNDLNRPLFFVYDLSGKMVGSFGEHVIKTDNSFYRSSVMISKSFSNNRFYYLPRFTGFVGLYQDGMLTMVKETIDGLKAGKKNIPVTKTVMKETIARTVDKKHETVVMHALHEEFIFIKTHDYEEKRTYWDIYGINDFDYRLSVKDPPISREIAIYDNYLAVLLETEIQIYDLTEILQEIEKPIGN